MKFETLIVATLCYVERRLQISCFGHGGSGSVWCPGAGSDNPPTRAQIGFVWATATAAATANNTGLGIPGWPPGSRTHVSQAVVVIP